MEKRAFHLSTKMRVQILKNSERKSSKLVFLTINYIGEKKEKLLRSGLARNELDFKKIQEL